MILGFITNSGEMTVFRKTAIQCEKLTRASVNELVSPEFAISFTRVVTGDYVACKHDIANGKLGVGSAIDAAQAKELVNQVDITSAPIESWVNPQVLYQSHGCLAWYRPASKKPEPIWFRTNDQLKLMVKLPTLVFITNGKGLRVFASASTKVTRDTPLYHAPLCNISSNGGLCFGGADAPEPTLSLSARMSGFEAALLESNFSHLSQAPTFKAQGKSDFNSTHAHIKIWKSFEALGKAPKASDMVKTGKTVADVVREIER